MKYRVEVYGHVTRFCCRNIITYAKNEEEAIIKAKRKYVEIEMKLPKAVDAGTTAVDTVELLSE